LFLSLEKLYYSSASKKIIGVIERGFFPCGFCRIAFFFVLITKNKIVGQYTVSDIVELGKNAINQCQKDLPRSKHCDLVITAKVADKTVGVK